MDKIRPIEIFCGTGGVGKTTIASSRAIHLAKNQNVLLITIDPSKRLKQVLKLSDATPGEVVECDFENTKFDVLLMDPLSTLRKISEKQNIDIDNANYLLPLLFKPFGGMNEIMSLVELYLLKEDSIYDVIILDTPPGKHFLDFLNTARSINNFFDSSFPEIFKAIKGNNKKKGLFSKIVSSGIGKLMKYLEFVTGPDFTENFIDSIIVIYSLKDVFLNSLAVEKELNNPDTTHYYLVTSADQTKIKEADQLSNSALKEQNRNGTLVINKICSQFLQDWTPHNDQLFDLRNNLLERENLIKQLLSDAFDDVLEFPEILSNDPSVHVTKLLNNW